MKINLFNILSHMKYYLKQKFILSFIHTRKNGKNIKIKSIDLYLKKKLFYIINAGLFFLSHVLAQKNVFLFEILCNHIIFANINSFFPNSHFWTFDKFEFYQFSSKKSYFKDNILSNAIFYINYCWMHDRSMEV